MLFVTLEEKTSLFAKTPLFLEGMKGFYRVEKKKRNKEIGFHSHVGPCYFLVGTEGRLYTLRQLQKRHIY